jgi:Family of unknown function (DUF5946)
MTHAIHRVERFEVVGPYSLALRFEDGTEQRIDFRPVLEGELFGHYRMTTAPTETRSTTEASCPSCGALLGGHAACQAVFDELSAQAWTSPGRASVHNLVVDTYAMQHPEKYCISAKSYIAHLTALCCGLEHFGDQHLYWAIPRWLDGPTAIEKPRLITDRGSVTISDVRAPQVESEYPDLVRQWARCVWMAYSAQQPLARGWLNAVRGQMIQARPKRR